MAAKYYTYRNLHGGKTQRYSTKYKGKVVWRGTEAEISGPVEFRVSAAGRARVLKEGVKNVHAFIVSDAPPRSITREKPTGLRVVYNPLMYDTFCIYVYGTPAIKDYTDGVRLRDTGVWLLKGKTKKGKGK